MEKIRILIVDDHKDVGDALRELLAFEETTEVVAVATSGRDAIDAARSLRPDLVLMDFSMAGMDGIDAASAIREECPGTVVVILSVYEPRENAERAKLAGVERWIPKSLPPDQLLSELRSISARHKGSSALDS